MEDFDLQLVVDQLISSEARLLQAVAGLSREQWNFREGSERWSIGENVEHLAIFEDFIRSVVDRALAGPAETVKAGASLSKETLVMGLATNREVRLVSREVVRPCGRWPEMVDAIEAFRTTRRSSIEFCMATEGDLRGRFFAHIAFGDLDCYQWMLLLGQHTFRHVLQIEEIKANDTYQAS